MNTPAPNAVTTSLSHDLINVPELRKCLTPKYPDHITPRRKKAFHIDNISRPILEKSSPAYLPRFPTKPSSVSYFRIKVHWPPNLLTMILSKLHDQI